MRKRLFGIACLAVLLTIWGDSVASAVTVNPSHFPDDNFREYVSRLFDWNNDGVLSNKEIAGVTYISVSYHNISSLQGLEYFTALEELDCSDNQLTTLDVSKNTKLTYLFCGLNQLTNLDVSKNTKLTHLDCSDNQLTTLNLSKSSKLTRLVCSGNQLKTLDVNKNAPLSEVYCDSQKATFSPLNITSSGNASYPFQLDFRDYMSSAQIAKISTDVKGYFGVTNSAGWEIYDTIPTKYSIRIARFASKPATVKYTYIVAPATASRDAVTMDVMITTPLADVAVNATNFPDETFREYVSNNFDGNGNGVLSHDEIADARWLNIQDSQISSLQGIEYLVNLNGLNCDGNRLTELDVSNNNALRTLQCSSNRLTELTVGQYTALEKLDCDNNRLTSFDVSYSTRLTSLSCQESSRLVALDLSKVTALKNLTCYNTGLISLDVSGCTELTELHCQYSQLKELDLRKKTKLRKVHCNNNQLTKLRLSKNAELEELECQGNYLTALNVRDCTELTKLNCGWNQLTELDVSQNPELSYLNCQENHLAVLDVSHNEYLTGLDPWSQTITPLFVVSNGDGYYPYKVNLTNYMTAEQVANISGLDVHDYNGNWIPAMIQDGFVYCSSFPSSVTYYYAVGYNSVNMGVNIYDATYIAPPEISGTFANGKLLAKYSQSVTISGDTAPYACEMTGGTLPKGLKLKFSKAKITLYGTPKESGEFAFMIQITDANKATTTQALALKITRPDITGTLSNGTVNGEYSGRLTVSGGTNPYTWEISSGTLPDGLKLTYSDDVATLSGTPTKVGSYKFAVRATDANKAVKTKSYTVKITQPTISGTLADSTLKAAYSKTLTVSGGVAPYKWTKSSGELPTGLKLKSSNTKATISGTPTTAGTFTFKIKVTDANKAAVTKSFTVKITQPTISGTLANGKRKANYSKSVTVKGGVSPYKWTKSSGTLPNGLKLTYSGTKATISGTPTKAGTFTFTLKVTDANKATATQSFTVNITQPTISGTLADGTVKTKYTGTLKVSGGTSSYTWVKASGTLPNGLKLTSSNTKATISGTPTKAGTFTFKIKVTDANGAATSKSFTVKIAEASASSKDSSSKTNSQSEKTSEKNQSEQAKSPDETQSSLPENSPETLEGEDTDVSIYAELKVVSEDIVESYDDKDSDMVKVKAGTPLRFTVGDWGTEVVDVVVYVDDKPVNSVEVSDEGKFTLPAEIVHDDFKVVLKAQSTTGKRESEELYIIAE